MSEYASPSADDLGPDPTGGATAFDATRDPWARPAETRPPQAQPPAAQPPEAEPPWYGTGPSAGTPPLGAPPFSVPTYQPPTAPGSAGQPSAAPSYGPPAYGQPPPPYAVPAYPGGYLTAPPQNSGKATTVLVLGIASLVLLMMWGIGVVPAVISLAMSGRAKREIEASQGRLGGLGMVTAGRITSWITIGLFTILAVVVVIALANSGGSDGQYGGF